MIPCPEVQSVVVVHRQNRISAYVPGTVGGQLISLAL